MKKLISLSIDVTKLDKARLYQGNKGTYASLTLHLNDERDQYDNNGFITEDVTKEERESGVKGTIVGNAKTVWQDTVQPSPKPAFTPKFSLKKEEEIDGPIPF